MKAQRRGSSIVPPGQHRSITRLFKKPNGADNKQGTGLLQQPVPFRHRKDQKAMAKKKKLPAGFTQRADGRIVHSFTFNGRRVSVYGQSVNECREKAFEKRKALEEGLTGRDTTIEKWLQYWSTNREKSLTGGSIRTNNKHMRRACRQIVNGASFGNIRLSKLEAVHVRELQKVLAAKFTTRTTNDTIAYLKQGIEAAVNDRIINWNPCNGIESLRRIEEQARDTTHRCLEREEVERFTDQAEKSNSRYINLYAVLLQTGLRSGEAAAFSPSDVRGDQLHITKTVTREETGYCIREQTKTEAGRRVVPLTEKARAAIREEMHLQRLLTGTVRIDKPVFQNSRGGVLNNNSINEDIARICKKADIEKFTAHAFRATFISRCIEDGMQIKELMEICGHKDVQMTLALYAHSNDQKKAKALKSVAL